MVMFEMRDSICSALSSSALASGAFFSEQIQTRMAALILALYPFTTFLHKFFDFFFVLSNPNGSQLRNIFLKFFSAMTTLMEPRAILFSF